MSAGLTKVAGGLLIPESEASVPTDDGVALRAKAGQLQSAVKNGAWTALGGGAVAPWFSNVAQFIQSLQPTLLAATLASECASLGLELESTAATGSGVATVVTTSPGGIVRSATGVTANSFKSIRNRNGVVEPVISNLRTAKWAAATRFKVVQTQATFFFRLVNLTDEATFDSGLCLDQTVSGVNYCLKVGSAAAVDLGVAFDTTAFHTGLVIADGTNVKAYLGAADGSGLVQLGAAAGQAQSTAPNTAGAWNGFPTNLATAANVEQWLDSVLVLTERA